MNDAFLSADEAQRFLQRNPAATWIDLILFDMNGIARGKRIRRDDLMGVAMHGLMVPASVFIMDVRGNCVEETGRLWETGDPDIAFRILAGTLKPVPVGDGRHAQAVIAVTEEDDLDPRGLLVKEVTKLRSVGQTACVAVELEFYVAKARANGAFKLEMPDGLSDDPDFPMTFQFEELDALAPFIDDIYKMAAVQDLPVDAVMQESGPAQFEINLKHKPDAAAAALDGALLKRAVKAAATANGLEAIFMAKPHHDWPGSGMHVHASLLDAEGRNLFAGDGLSALARQAVGGLQQTMPEFMAIWAQSANSYRRYVPKAYVPMTAGWGLNNRNVALRIPKQMGDATRIEHRVSGADANPFLVVAAILAGMRQGIAAKAEPGQIANGDETRPDAPVLPTAWSGALAKFKSSSVVREAFGASFQDVYYRLKETERANFERIVTSLDYEWYARVA